MTGSSEEAVWNEGIRIVPVDEEMAASCVTVDKFDAYALFSAQAPKSQRSVPQEHALRKTCSKQCYQ
jgi:hypothetical protein